MPVPRRTPLRYLPRRIPTAIRRNKKAKTMRAIKMMRKKTSMKNWNTMRSFNSWITKSNRFTDSRDSFRKNKGSGTKNSRG